MLCAISIFYLRQFLSGAHIWNKKMTLLFFSLMFASWILYLLVNNHLLVSLQLEKYDLAREAILSGLQVDPLR